MTSPAKKRFLEVLLRALTGLMNGFREYCRDEHGVTLN